MYIQGWIGDLNATVCTAEQASVRTELDSGY